MHEHEPTRNDIYVSLCADIEELHGALTQVAIVAARIEASLEEDGDTLDASHAELARLNRLMLDLYLSMGACKVSLQGWQLLLAQQIEEARHGRDLLKFALR